MLLLKRFKSVREFKGITKIEMAEMLELKQPTIVITN